MNGRNVSGGSWEVKFICDRSIIKYYNCAMHQYSNLNEGIYLVQSGYRNHTAIIECPYVSHKIEVYGAQ
jgi:hypothetical protein